MAGRNIKTGLDYFSLDVAMDDKVELLEAEYGLTGFAVFVKVLQRIYGGNGYYCEWNEEVELLFSKRLNEGRNSVSEIVQAAIRRGIFDESLFESYGILTSHGIQSRYLGAVERRQKVNLINEYLLVHDASSFKNVNIVSIYDDINGNDSCRNAQSKVKHSKAEHSKEKHIAQTDQKSVCAASGAPPVIRLILNNGDLWDVTAAQFSKWKELYPEVDVMTELRKMAGWLDANPKRRKTRSGIKRFCNTWLSREQDGGGIYRNAGKGAPVVKMDDPDSTRRGELMDEIERKQVEAVMHMEIDDE